MRGLTWACQNGSCTVAAQTPVVTDRLGSVRAYQTNGTWRTLSYFPFGEEKTPVTPDGAEKFGTYVRDSTLGSQDYAMQRYYSPNAGRFNSPDPGGVKTANPRDPGSWNRYAYVQGDPINGFDPKGLYAALPSCYWNEDDPECADGGSGGDSCDPNTAAVFGFLPFESGCYGGGAPVDSTTAPPPQPTCQATLYSRPLDYKVAQTLGWPTHAYWEVQEVLAGTVVFDDMISAGPSPNPPSNPATGQTVTALDVWVGPASGKDTPQNATWSWSTGSSASNCDGVLAMLSTATYWQNHLNDSPSFGIPYHAWPWPNSNSFADYIGEQVGGFSPPRPPGASGWGYPFD